MGWSATEGLVERLVEWRAQILETCSLENLIKLLIKHLFDLTFKLNRVKAVEKEKDELEGSKNEAVEYLNMENAITKQRNVLFQRYM